jgi:hypothetical protein
VTRNDDDDDDDDNKACVKPGLYILHYGMVERISSFSLSIKDNRNLLLKTRK